MVFGEKPENTNEDATKWLVQGMYNDDKNGTPDHIEEVQKYLYLGTWFHQNRTWETQFQEAAKKVWTTTADKWMEAGAVRMGAGELVANKMWIAIAAPAIEYDSLVTVSTTQMAPRSKR